MPGPVRRARARPRPSPKQLLLRAALFLIAIQLVPYGRSHLNPPVVVEPVWDAPATRALAVKACFDCHSNQTRWPRYAWVAPASWLVQNDVDGGRTHLNFSEWQRPQRHAKDAADEVRTRDMPPSEYLLVHSEARLSDTEREQLAAAFDRMFGGK